MGPPGQPRAGNEDDRPLGQLVDRCGHGGIPGYGLGPRVFRILSGDRAGADMGGLVNVGI